MASRKTEDKEPGAGLRGEPIFNHMPADLQIELQRILTTSRKRTKGRARMFKASTIDPALVAEFAKFMSFERIQEMLMFTGTTKELDAAYKRGRADGVSMVGDKVYQLAMEGVPWAVKMYLMSRDPKNWRDTSAPASVTQEAVTQAPDPFACLASRTQEELLKIAGVK